MKRFITYIYEYKNGQKCSNAGFMKVDWRQEQCRLEVHIRNLSVKQEQVSCYWVIRDKENVEGILWGKVEVIQGKGDGQIMFSKKMGNALSFSLEDVIGIAIKGNQTGYLATSWVDNPGIKFLYGSFEEKSNELLKKEKLIEEVKAAELAKKSAPSKEIVQSENESPSKEIVQSEKESPSKEVQQSTKENPSKEVLQCAKESQKQENPMELGMKRISLHDIRSLPSANWYLCNNSFLIHGFFNYKYLVIKEIEENGKRKTYLGVPGIFEKPEMGMAQLFGFPKFEAEASPLQGEVPAMAVSDEIEDVPEGTFGYWFCLLDI